MNRMCLPRVETEGMQAKVQARLKAGDKRAMGTMGTMGMRVGQPMLAMGEALQG